jgi:hypothetical protein
MHYLRPKPALLLTLLVLAPGFATATELPGGPAFIQAADAVIAAQGEAGATPPPPVTDPRVQTLLARAANVDAIFGNVKLTAADLGPVMDLCGKTNQITMGYALANIVSLKPPAGQTADPEALKPRVIELGNRNAVAYQDVIIPMGAFSTRCMMRALPLLTEFMRTLPAEQRTPVRMGGLRQMRGGVANMMVGAITSSIQTGVSAANRHLALSAAADVASTFAAALPVADRKAIQQTAVRVRPSAAAADQPSLDAIARAFADERCEGLCALGS